MISVTSQALTVRHLTQTAQPTSMSHIPPWFGFLDHSAPSMYLSDKLHVQKQLSNWKMMPSFPSVTRWQDLHITNHVEMIGNSPDDTNGSGSKERIKKDTQNEEWIHSENYSITRPACAYNKPLSLDLRVFVQNHTEALCSQTALETALMFIQITNKCSVMMDPIFSLKVSNKKRPYHQKEKVFFLHLKNYQCPFDTALACSRKRQASETDSFPCHSISSAFLSMKL